MRFSVGKYAVFEFLENGQGEYLDHDWEKVKPYCGAMIWRMNDVGR